MVCDGVQIFPRRRTPEHPSEHFRLFPFFLGQTAAKWANPCEISSAEWNWWNMVDLCGCSEETRRRRQWTVENASLVIVESTVFAVFFTCLIVITPENSTLDAETSRNKWTRNTLLSSN